MKLINNSFFSLIVLNLVFVSSTMVCSSCRSAKQYLNQYETRQNAQKLRVGMTKTEVIGIMGPPVSSNFGYENVLFFYVETQWQDFQDTIDETLPVVFDKNNKVVGFGKEYFQNNLMFKKKYDFK
ncbi:outer membrane protein assembly factor BamE [Lentisphaerota bacterium WC36G]|nr:outer membrane protein assembly factor BamE [Lentisphaerae bacterium WC36]